MGKQWSRPVGFFLLLSLVMHIFFGTGLWWVQGPNLAPINESVEVTILSPPMTEPKKPEAGQIVEQEKQINDDTPENSKYLSQFNQRVVEETKAKTTGAFQNDPAPQAQSQVPRQTKKSPRGELPKLKDLTPQWDFAKAQNSDPSSTQGLGAQSDDHLKDVKDGPQTLLSTREFLYYSYYTRIKQRIRQFWEPGVRDKVKILYRSGRSIASAQDKITQLVVTLDASGQLVEISVITQSGVEDLDEAAIEAFRAAAPFPNPPKGMVEKDGRIRIRWDFILEA